MVVPNLSWYPVTLSETDRFLATAHSFCTEICALSTLVPEVHVNGYVCKQDSQLTKPGIGSNSSFTGDFWPGKRKIFQQTDFILLSTF